MAPSNYSTAAQHPRENALALAPKAKKAGGGTTAAGGSNFQAIVTTIAASHLLAGKPLGWLSGLADDTPSGIWAESEGPGDDLRIGLADTLPVGPLGAIENENTICHERTFDRS